MRTVKNEQMKLGSIEHKHKAVESFTELFDEMTELMKIARSFEFHITVQRDIEQHKNYADGKDYETFSNANFVADQQKVDRMLKKVVPDEELRKFLCIREFADALAHASYFKGRRKIREYLTEFDDISRINNAKLPERLVHNILDENGQKTAFAAHLDSNQTNLMLDEFKVFKHQNYFTVAKEILADATQELTTKSDLAWNYEMLSIMRAIRKRHIIES